MHPTGAIWKFFIYLFGNEEQKAKSLIPLLSGEIRSVFGMTEHDVASSDATNMPSSISLEGDEVVVNGKNGGAPV